MIFWVIYHCDHHPFHHYCENKSCNIKTHKLNRMFISPFCYMSKHLELSGYLTNICCDWLSLTNSMYSPQFLSNLTLHVTGNCSLLVLLYIILGKFLLQKNKQKNGKANTTCDISSWNSQLSQGNKKKKTTPSVLLWLLHVHAYKGMHTWTCLYTQKNMHKSVLDW